MTDRTDNEVTNPAPPEGTILEFGGLRFNVSFRSLGATLRVEGRVNGIWTEMLRFDDFVDQPHFHAPAGRDQIPFERTQYGDPLVWYVAQVRDHLVEWLEQAGFADVIPTVDVEAVSDNAHRLTDAMIACTPEGFVRVPGFGLQRIKSST